MNCFWIQTWKNLHMGDLERISFLKCKKQLVFLLDILMTYVEYGQEQKPIFKHPSIRLELRFSKTSKAFFLDVTISLTDGFLSTNLYSKPTNKHMVLKWKKN